MELVRVNAALEAQCEKHLAKLKTMSEVLETTESRARMAEEANNERSAQAAFQSQSLQDQLLEARAAAARERSAAHEATMARSAAEAELEALEARSREVLSDCRALQSKIRTLEAERANSGDAEECHVLHAHARVLEEQRAELDQQATELASLQQREQMLREELTERDVAIMSAEEGRRRTEEARAKQSSTDQLRLMELEQEITRLQTSLGMDRHKAEVDNLRTSELQSELADARTMIATHESNSKEHRKERAHLIELQQELEEAVQVRDSHARQHQHHRTMIAELEQQLAEAHQQIAGQVRQHNALRNNIVKLENEAAEAGAERDHQVRHVHLHRSELEELQKQLREHESQKTRQSNHHEELRSKVEELENDLMRERGLQRQHATRAQDLEKQLHEAASEKKRNSGQLELCEQQAIESKTVHKNQVCELQQQVDDASRELVNATRREEDLQRQLQIATDEINNLRASKEIEQQQAASLGLQARKSQQLEDDLSESREALDDQSKRIHNLQQELANVKGTHKESIDKVHLLERQLHEAQNSCDFQAKRADNLEQEMVNLHGNGDQIHRLERKLHEAHSASDFQMKRADDLEEELATWRQTHDQHVERIYELERQLSEIRQKEENRLAHAGEEAEQIRTLEQQLDQSKMAQDQLIQQAEASMKSASTKEAELEAALAEERRARASAERSAAQASAAAHQATQKAEDLQKDANVVFERSEQARKRMHEECEEKLQTQEQTERQLRERIDELESQLLMKVSPPLAAASHAHDQHIEYATTLPNASQEPPNESNRHRTSSAVRGAHQRTSLQLQHAAVDTSHRRSSSGYADVDQLTAHRFSLEFHSVAGSNSRDHGNIVTKRPPVDGIPEPYLEVLDQIEKQGWQSVDWKDGFTMLHWAAKKGRGELCSYLINLGADPDALDTHGRTPMDCAQEAGHSHVAEHLQVMAPDLGSMSAGGSEADLSMGLPMPPQSSIPESHLQVIEQIDQSGWDSVDWLHGYTLLHWAAKNNNPELCARFMAQGARPGDRDAEGKNAFDYAREHGSKAALLQMEKGAPTEVPKRVPLLVAQEPRTSKAVTAWPRIPQPALQAGDAMYSARE